MGYVKLTAGPDSGAEFVGSTILVPADNVASVKDDGGDVIIKYFGGYELYFSLDGSGTQADVDAFIGAIDKANGISGKPVSLTLPSDPAYLFGGAGIVQAWS
jgi:hypothetical protein